MSFLFSSSSPHSLPTFSTHNGVQIPCLAFGLAFGSVLGSEFEGMCPERSWEPIEIALKAGFRHFDGAHAYSNERHLGDSLARYFKSKAIVRSDLFLTTKLGHPKLEHTYMSSARTWNPRDYSVDDVKDKVLADFDQNLQDLGVGYVDLLLMHWPGAFTEKDEAFARANRLRIWRVFEDLYKKKAARAIGVSNFTRKHLEQLLEDGAEVCPMVNQLETHPYCHDRELMHFCHEKRIVVEAYAPLASGNFDIFHDYQLQKIAKEVNRSVGQVILRWHHQHGRIPLPKTCSPIRAKENLHIFDFELTAAHMKTIDDLHPRNQAPKRTCPDPYTIL